jgi:hypothetical protein
MRTTTGGGPMRANPQRWVALVFAAVAPLLAIGLLGCDTNSITDAIMGKSSTTLPVINALVPPQAKIGAAVAVQGTGFGTTAGDAGFQDPTNGNKIPAQVDAWTDTLVVVRVPFVPGSNVAAVTTKFGLATSDGRSPASLPAFTITTQ